MVTAVCFAEFGHNVTIVDVDSEKVHKISNGIPPIFEQGLENLLQKHIHKKLFASTSFDSVLESNVIYICVGTPQADDGTADLSYIASAAASIGKALTGSRLFHVNS